MKAFVIKNKEGKYHKRGFSCWENIERDGVFNTGHFYYENKEEAENCIVSYGLEDCKVVEITIEEGDLEKQLAEKDKEIETLQKEKELDNIFWKQECDSLQKTLKEKDKEIEYLGERNFYKVSLKNEEWLGVYPKNIEKIIRKQVCDEIREAIKTLIEERDNTLTNWEYANGWCQGLQYDMAKLLDQIEKGEIK